MGAVGWRLYPASVMHIVPIDGDTKGTNFVELAIAAFRYPDIEGSHLDIRMELLSAFIHTFARSAAWRRGYHGFRLHGARYTK
jgi:hypothetical protein